MCVPRSVNDARFGGFFFFFFFFVSTFGGGPFDFFEFCSTGLTIVADTADTGSAVTVVSVDRIGCVTVFAPLYLKVDFCGFLRLSLDPIRDP